MAGDYTVWKSISCLLSISTLIHIGVAETTPSSVIDNYGACNGLWGQPLEVRAQPGQEKFIESPDFPFNYPNSAECKWRISTNLTGYVIKLETVFVELENRSDVFQVFDGNSSSSPTLLQMSTMSVARNLTTYSSGPSVYVTFTTDDSTPYQGFRLRFMAVLKSTSDSSLTCNPSLMPVTLAAYPDVVQNIRSVRYPSNYSINADCNWLIEADYGYVIQLYVREMDLEIGNSCSFDYLVFHDGGTSYSPMLTKLCNSSQQYVYSTGQRMFIRFRSDSSVVRKGFFLQYTAVPETDRPPSLDACNSWSIPRSLYISPGETNFIESPNYPYAYPNAASCRWVISTYYIGYVVELRTVYVNLESSDVIKVYTGYNDSTLLRSFSTMQDTPVQSTEQSMYVTFTSDSTITYSGFRLSYTAVLRNGPTFMTTTSSTALQACSLGSRPLYLSIFAGETNFIQSPNYPYEYPNNAECGWIISTYSSDYVVELSTDYVDLENRYDLLNVYDGSSIYGSALLRSISSNQSTPVQSTGQYMYVMFTSDGSNTKTGFRLSYRAVLRNGPSFTTTSSSLQACSLESRPLYLSIFAGETNFIQSPNYPYEYPNNAVCGWIISTYSSDYVVELSTDYVDLENRYDLLKVYDGSSIYDGALLQSISSIQNTPIQSTGQSMYVTFTSDDTTTKTGFRLSYRAVLPNGPSLTTTSLPFYHAAYQSSSSLWLIIGVVLGAIGIFALIISIIVVVKCRRRPRVPIARLCIPPAHMAASYNNVFAQPGSQANQFCNSIYVVPTPDPSMPTAIYASAPPSYDNIAFTACFNEPSRDIPQQPLENPMCCPHPETGDAPPEYSKIQHSDAACVA